MEEDKTKLTDSQLKTVKEWLDEKWVSDPKCPVCGTTKWSIASHTVSPIVMSGLNINLGGISYPQVPVICENCGNTRYFNAVMMGIMPDTGKPDEKEGSKKSPQKEKDGPKRPK